MIEVENIEVFNWEGAIRGMRNPLNSWEKSDSVYIGEPMEFMIGPNDLALVRKLCRAGSDHRKFLRQILVSMDITAPLYWWKEFDTYKVGTVANSCSTMHTIHKKPFELDNFSHEHLNKFNLNLLDMTIRNLNTDREHYLETKDKSDWLQMIQMLPSSYNQKRTVTLNYEVLLNMYHARKAHKLDEWHTLCDHIKAMPYFTDICLEG